MPTIDVSIVMCSHNRVDAMRQALESLVCQETDGLFGYEVVIVHTGRPETVRAIDEVGKSAGVPVRGIHEPRRGQVAARNRGLAEARGQWIAHFDDDQVAEPYWLKELWKLAHEKSCRSVGGVLLLRLPEGCQRRLSPGVRRMLGETVPWDTPRPYTEREGPGTGNLMVHRTVFDEVGMYDESFTLRGYDTDLYRRMRMAGIESWFAPKAVGYHVIPPDRLDDVFFQETSLHTGWSFVRRDRLARGNAAAVCIAAARVGQAAGLNLPRLWWALLRGDPDQALDIKIRLWRAEGYLRGLLYWILPRLFPQRRFFARFEFRSERRVPMAGQGEEQQQLVTAPNASAGHGLAPKP